MVKLYDKIPKSTKDIQKSVKPDYVKLKNVNIINETEKAILLKTKKFEVWVPKSVIKSRRDVKDGVNLEVKEWWFSKWYDNNKKEK